MGASVRKVTRNWNKARRRLVFPTPLTGPGVGVATSGAASTGCWGLFLAGCEPTAPSGCVCLHFPRPRCPSELHLRGRMCGDETAARVCLSLTRGPNCRGLGPAVPAPRLRSRIASASLGPSRSTETLGSASPFLQGDTLLWWRGSPRGCRLAQRAGPPLTTKVPLLRPFVLRRCVLDVLLG